MHEDFPSNTVNNEVKVFHCVREMLTDSFAIPITYSLYIHRHPNKTGKNNDKESTDIDQMVDWCSRLGDTAG